MAKEVFVEKESLVDIAYRLLSKRKKERSFYNLWEDVKTEKAKLDGIDPNELEEDISFFYTNLTLDGRFVNVGDNKWNLKERVPFKMVDTDDATIYGEEEQGEEGEEESDFPYSTVDDTYDDSTGSDTAVQQDEEDEENSEF